GGAGAGRPARGGVDRPPGGPGSGAGFPGGRPRCGACWGGEPGLAGNPAGGGRPLRPVSLIILFRQRRQESVARLANPLATRSLGVAGIPTETTGLEVLRYGRGACTVLRLAGELDLSTAHQVRNAFPAELAGRRGRRHLVLDLRRLRFVDSSGLGVLFELYRWVTAQGAGWRWSARRPQWPGRCAWPGTGS